MSLKDKVDVLLIYPRLGVFDSIIKDIPLSLVYAAADTVKSGFRVKIVDCRLHENYLEIIAESLRAGCSLVGISVMTGYPIKTSLAISRFVKDHSTVPIVWGGPHPTILPEQTLMNDCIDFVIRDWGSTPLRELTAALTHGSCRLDEITGLGYKDAGAIRLNPATCSFEVIAYKDIPYHLIHSDMAKYNRLQSAEFFFPIYTSVGCPCQCSFCMAPSVYKKLKGKKWLPYPVDQVIEHIEYLMSKYDFQRLQVYDDNSFVDLNRMKTFFLAYLAKGFHRKLKIDFRGIRIDELDRMDDDFLKLMTEANVEILEIGAESGSNRSLKRMIKGITVEQTLRVSKKLARYPSLLPHYNILCGIPGETLEDLIMTKRLMETLVEDNPSCLLGGAADWKPLPGSAMTETAVRHYGLTLPSKLEEWIDIDTTDAKKIVHPWYTRQTNNYIKLLQVASLFMDRKIETVERLLSRDMPIVRFLLSCAKLYRPIIRWRLRSDFAGFLLEYPIKNYALRLISRLMKRIHRSAKRSKA
jgi:radical SAM superfamily enzyme YgiQ (UPF0313 family)